MLSTINNMHVIEIQKTSETNFPFKIMNDANNHRNNSNKHGVKSLICSNSSIKLSSFSNESKNVVGVIGGVSVLSTLIFLEKFVLWGSRKCQGGVPFIVCSDPFMKRRLYNKNTFMVENMRSKRVFLEEGGAKCIVMPCHVSHALYGEISLGCELPFLHVARCVARELVEARFRPLEAGCGVKIGLIANEATLLAGFYQDELKKQGFEVAMPDRLTMEHIVKPAMKCMKQNDVVGARNLLRIAIQGLLVKAVNVVILASDELQCLLPYDDPLVKYCVDPLDSLARSTVNWANSVQEDTQEIYR
ncbi:hypothetical protein RND81_07G106700 [Saponaria officinalis]|uniref:Aspartate racemase n=1 Tax=Saponaria officinalis TaxID=3572 RepID=A0AAW1JPV1_SAPOF